MVPPVVAEHLCCDDPLCTIRDATDLTEEVSALFERYKVFGLPTIVFINSSGGVHPERVNGFLSPQKFSAVMAAVK